MAAGESRRFGRRVNKLLLDFHGRPLLQRAVDAASLSLAMSCTLVVGADARRLLDSIDSRRCAVVYNAGWREGIASSIRAGLAHHDADEACLFVVGDQPFVVAEDLNAIIARHRVARGAIVALRSGDVWGAPALFPARDFGALLKLRGDSGAKRYAERHRSRLECVDAISPGAFNDVDTSEAYERAIKLASESENPRTHPFHARRSPRRP